jgi:predicted Rossmann-fold nucleotide-binding protein
MMGAVAKAARAGGARTIGVIPEIFSIDNEFTSPDKDAHELIVCKSMVERKLRMQALSDGFLVLPGGIGEQFQFRVGHSMFYHPNNPNRNS